MDPSQPSTLKPRPAPDALERPFWEGIAERQLRIQHCRACRTWVHPPYPECTGCRASDFDFESVSGRGRIFQRVIVESPVVVGFEGEVPYACLVVELEEQSELLVAGRLVEAGPHEAVIGRRVELVFREESDGFTLPVFRLADPPE